MGIKGPLKTMSGCYWASQSDEIMKCLPPKSDNLPFPIGGIWVHDVKKGPNQEAIRQAFVYNTEDDWLVVPREALEKGAAAFPHPQYADLWFAMGGDGKPKWLKADMLAKYKRTKMMNQALGKLEGIPATVIAAAGDQPHVKARTVKVEGVAEDVIGPAATAQLHATPYHSNNVTRANPPGG
ncbi:hypothetical protein PM082_016208 [Marasmius tenuissimus]|nr:hypothetical protein PM082_016208 [Marasmius tenuissimus]